MWNCDVWNGHSVKSSHLDVTKSNDVAPRLVVPRHDRGVLVEPPFAQLIEVIQQNRSLLSRDLSVYGDSLHAWREEARAAVIAESLAYTASLTGEDIAPPSDDPLIVTGHQPELFHAGVWAKNFAAAGLAGKTSGTSLNLIIDNDTVTTTRVKVPVGTQQSPGVEWIPFDMAVSQRPWEDATISDPECFESFGQRVADQIQAFWNYQPLVAHRWSAAKQHANVSRRLCDCLAAMRVTVERSHGVHNLEVPMSRVCSTRPFQRFIAAILGEHPSFHSSYNQIVRDYRRKYHLKSTTHPVPELEISDDWFEAPFWIWQAGEERRDRPFARRIADEIELRDSRRVLGRLPVHGNDQLQRGADVLQELARQGIRIRTRALTTTLFARVFLSDLFIHGIGGAKYDEMTDSICARLLKSLAPQFATVSATAYPPLPPPFPVTDESLRSTEHQLRDVQYNPDRHLSIDSPTPIQSLIHQKQQILKGIAGRHPSAEEHRTLQQINSQLGQHAEAVRERLRANSEAIRDQLKANAVLRDREFAWCLHPEASLTTFLKTEFGG